MSDEYQMKIKEDRLLDQTGTYRFLYWFAAFFAAVMFTSWVLIVNNFGKFQDPDIGNFPFGAALFFAVLCSYARAKLSHIETIRRYRQRSSA